MSAQERKHSPQKRQNDESEQNESFQLTTEEQEEAKEIVKNLMKANRTQSYAERAKRRELQEQLLTELAAAEKVHDVATTHLENLSEAIQESTDAFHYIEQIYAIEQLEKEKEDEERYADEANPALILDETDEICQSEDDDSDSGTQPNFIGLNRPQWALLGRRFGAILHKAPQLSCLNPLLDLEKDAEVVEKKEARKARAKDEKIEQLTLKNKEQGEHAEEEMAVSKELNTVRKALRRTFRANNGKVEYYRFIIDPTDFSKTVENIFHVSFLVKDGIARLDMDEETEMPTLYELSNEEREKMKQDEANGESTNQAIMAFSMEHWTEIILALDITEPMIPSATTND